MFICLSACNREKRNIKCQATINKNSWLWHKRLAHAHMNLITKLSKKKLVIRLPKITYEKDKLCDACQLSKQTIISFHAKNIISTNKCLKLIYMDLFGPSRTLSLGGRTYCLVMVIGWVTVSRNWTSPNGWKSHYLLIHPTIFTSFNPYKYSLSRSLLHTFKITHKLSQMSLKSLQHLFKWNHPLTKGLRPTTM